MVLLKNTNFWFCFKNFSLFSSKFARIQFRLPNGSASKSQNFEAEQPFLDAIHVAEGIVNLPSTQFHLVQMLPRREFTAEDLNKSFKELELVPSAVLMILPVSFSFYFLKLVKLLENYLRITLVLIRFFACHTINLSHFYNAPLIFKLQISVVLRHRRGWC